MNNFILILLNLFFGHHIANAAAISVKNHSDNKFECYFSYVTNIFDESNSTHFEMNDSFYHEFNQEHIVEYTFQIKQIDLFIYHYALPEDTLNITLNKKNYTIESSKTNWSNLTYSSQVGKKMRNFYYKTKDFQLYLDSGKIYLKRDLSIINDMTFKNSTLKKIYIEKSYIEYYTETINFLLENTIWSNRVKDIDVEVALDSIIDYNFINNPFVINSYYYRSFIDRYVRLKTGLLDEIPNLRQKDFLFKNLNGFGIDAFNIQLIRNALKQSTKEEHLQQLRSLVNYNHLISEETQQGLLTMIDSKMKYSEGKSFQIQEFEDINCKTFSLNDYKGKVIILDFWATWCGPCIQEMPEIKKLMDKLKNEDVILITLSIDDNHKKWSEYINKQNISGKHICLGGGYGNKYLNQLGINGIPRAIVLDKNHEIYDFNYSPENIRKAVRELKKLAK